MLVTAYALHRPDGQWSLMLINKDHDHPHQVRIAFHDADGKPGRIVRRAGHDDHVWKGAVPVASGPQEGTRRSGWPGRDFNVKWERKTREYNLPAASLTILRGRLRF